MSGLVEAVCYLGRDGRYSTRVYRLEGGDPVQCRYCPAWIVWARVPIKATRIPLDPPTTTGTDTRTSLYASHWLSCPGARQAAADRDAKRRTARA